MPSVDVVSKVDLQALDNAISNMKCEISTRFDFNNVKSEIPSLWWKKWTGIGAMLILGWSHPRISPYLRGSRSD